MHTELFIMNINPKITPRKLLLSDTFFHWPLGSLIAVKKKKVIISLKSSFVKFSFILLYD